MPVADVREHACVSAASKRVSTVRVVLAAGRRRELAAAPRVAQAGPPFVDLRPTCRPSQSPPLRSRKPVVGHDRDVEVGGDDLGGPRARAEVGGVDDARPEPVVGQGPGPGRGLLPRPARSSGASSQPCQRLFDVPCRLAVAEDQDLRLGAAWNGQ